MAEEVIIQPRKEENNIIEAFCVRIARFIGQKKHEDAVRIKRILESEDNKYPIKLILQQCIYLFIGNCSINL